MLLIITPIMIIGAVGFIGVKSLAALYGVSAIFAITFLPRGISSFLLLLESNVPEKKTNRVMWANVMEGFLIIAAALSLKFSRDIRPTVLIPLFLTIFLFFIFCCYSTESPEFLY